MYTEIYGYRINLINVAIFVAFYDIVHILYEYYNRYNMLRMYENWEMGCLNNFGSPHCKMVNRYQNSIINFIIN